MERNTSKLKSQKPKKKLIEQILIHKKKIKILILGILFFFVESEILSLFTMNKNISLNSIIKKFKGKNYKSNKVCICTFGKEENLYIREFIEHYKNYGVDKIYLYDNNDINGEKFDNVIADFVKGGYVYLFNWRGKKAPQFSFMNDCYQKTKNLYNWIMYPDIDEFIHLSNYTKVIDFLDEPKFNNCNIVYLNLLPHTDNGQLKYENRPLKERFPYHIPLTKQNLKRLEIKFIIRGNLSKIKLNLVHFGVAGMKKNCNGFGHKNRFNFYTTEPDTQFYYYIHYYCKSTEEFIQKLKRGGGDDHSLKFKYGRIKKYFQENKKTLEKILMIEKATGLKLSNYKQK